MNWNKKSGGMTIPVGMLLEMGAESFCGRETDVQDLGAKGFGFDLLEKTKGKKMIPVDLRLMDEGTKDTHCKEL